MTDQYEAKARETLDRVIHVSCFGDGCDFDLDTHEAIISAIASALEAERAEERELASVAVIAEAYWRHQGATPDKNTQTPEEIDAQNEAFERNCLLYMVGELGDVESLTDLQWQEIKRRAAAIRKRSDP